MFFAEFLIFQPAGFAFCGKLCFHTHFCLKADICDRDLSSQGQEQAISDTVSWRYLTTQRSISVPSMLPSSTSPICTGPTPAGVPVKI